MIYSIGVHFNCNPPKLQTGTMDGIWDVMQGYAVALWVNKPNVELNWTCVVLVSLVSNETNTDVCMCT